MRLFSPARLALPAVLLPLLPAAALAAAATASQDVNVRSGPATSYDVVGQLHRGEAVDVRQCEGLFCQVNFATGSGWVSAGFLVRGPATATPAPLVATTPQPTAPAKPGTAVIASTASPPATKSPAPLALPLGSFPPAYGAGNAGQPPTIRDAAPPANYAATDDEGSDDALDGTGARSSVTLPDDSGDVIASTDDAGAPRPKADVPGGLRTGPDDDTSLDDAGANPAGADLADVPADDGFDAPPPADDWRVGPRFGGRHAGWRDRFADLRGGDPQPAACFFGDTGFGGSGFCLRPGQSVADLGGWSDRIFALRNPARLRVTVCGVDPSQPCRIYERSGPLMSAGDGGIASIRVDAPGY